jgi:hypothetical protein
MASLLIGYRGSNNRDRDKAAERRGLPLSQRFRNIDWAMVALIVLLAAAVIVPGAAVVAVWYWLS